MTKDAEPNLRIDLVRWSDALSRHVDVPASAIWVMACLVYEVESTVPPESITPATRAWLFRTKEVVTQVVGASSWDEAVRVLLVPQRSQSSLAAWVKVGQAPPHLRELLADLIPPEDSA